ncbi:hypothetical protein ACIGCH_24350, partial [Pseudomonas helleri]|uniref:hypothetical protein n=1 Tax=Pseudomonas helleri TaxID=1608996 RepID=UPI0037CBFF26
RELDDVKRGPQEVEWIRAMIEGRTNQSLERAALERQEQAKAALKRFEKDQLSHDKGPSKGRGGPEFGM